MSLYCARQWPIIASRVSAEQYGLCQMQLNALLPKEAALKYSEDSRILYIEEGEEFEEEDNATWGRRREVVRSLFISLS